MKYIVFGILLIPLVSFSIHEPENEFDTKLYRRYFTEQERIELLRIVYFFDSIVLQQNRFTEIDKAYQYYYDSICELYNHNGTDNIGIDGEKSLNFFFSLDTTLFNKIWSKQIPKYVHTKDTNLYSPKNYYSIDLNHHGDYVRLLKKLGKSNVYFKQVHKDIVVLGGFSPAFYINFFNSKNTFDFNNISDRLFFSIALLTLNEPIEKKVKRYLERGNN